MGLDTLTTGTFPFYAPRFEIEIQNTKLAADMSKAIIDISVEEKIDEGAGFTFTVNDEFDMSTQTFKWLDHELFEVGNTVTIKIGYESELPTLLMGNITGLEPSFFAGETPTISVKGQDLSFDYIKRKSPEKTFVNLSYSDIARAVAKDAGLSAEVDTTGKYANSLRKPNDESYFSFLERLAGEVGFHFSIDRRTVCFKKPADDKKEILVFELGKDLISFRPNLNTAGLYSEVEVRGHDVDNPGTAIIGRATAGSERSQESGRQTASQVAQKCHKAPKRVITNVPVHSVSQANAIARAALDRAGDGFIEGDAEIIGIPQIRPGVCIKLDKMGKRFSGKYYVKGATHTFNSSGYRTRFTVKRNAL